MVKTSFTDFIDPLGSIQSGSSEKPKSYGDFSQEIWGVSASTETVTAHDVGAVHESDHGFGQDVQHLVHKVIHLGRQRDEVTGMLQKAEFGRDIDGNGLGALKERYGSERTTIQDVVLPQELIDHYGGDIKKLHFGAQSLARDSEKADAQYAKLREQVEMAKDYLGHDIQLHRINYDNGKPSVAVVMGVDAEEFNAVIRALRDREHYTKAHESAKEELAQATKGQKEVSADTVNQNRMQELENKFGFSQKPAEEVAANNNGMPSSQSTPSVPGQTSKKMEVA